MWGVSQPRAKARVYDDTAPPGLLPFRHRDFTSDSTDFGWEIDKVTSLRGGEALFGFPGMEPALLSGKFFSKMDIKE